MSLPCDAWKSAQCDKIVLYWLRTHLIESDETVTSKSKSKSKKSVAKEWPLEMTDLIALYLRAIQIFVKMVCPHKHFVIVCEANAKIASIREKITDKTGIKGEEMVIGTDLRPHLRDEFTLSDYDIHEHSTLHVKLRLRDDKT